ncbi:cupredoxin domain-containing protein [Mycolicibacterium gadium]|uniref:cupredoxin domain-containing protein n=1 Tax=Mycolicibacterium gadium TaxID=1794 RepID=UPI003A5C10AE
MMRRIDQWERRLARCAFAGVAVVSITLIGGCSGHVSPASDPTPPGLPEPTLTPPSSLSVENVFTIVIEDYEYSALSVPTETQVSVVNRDNVEHSITSDRAGLFDVHVKPNLTATFTAPEDLGLYPYHCTFHPSMRGTLVVE